VNTNTVQSDCCEAGTAIAGVVRAKAPDAELYSVKVFDNSLHTHAEVVAAAIRWTADHNLDVANCSLSKENAEHRDLLQEACDYAVVRGVLLIASCDDLAQELFPACLPAVIAVVGDERCAWDRYHYENLAKCSGHIRIRARSRGCRRD
jgi:hypothetical protein